MGNSLNFIEPLCLASESCPIKVNRELAAKLRDELKQLFQCDKCAEALKLKMKKMGIKGDNLFIDTKENGGYMGYIWSDRAGKSIATNGHHEAIKVGYGLR